MIELSLKKWNKIKHAYITWNDPDMSKNVNSYGQNWQITLRMYMGYNITRYVKLLARTKVIIQ